MIEAGGCAGGLWQAELLAERHASGDCTRPQADEFRYMLDREDVSGLSAEAEGRCYLVRYCEVYEAECGGLGLCDLIER